MNRITRRSEENDIVWLADEYAPHPQLVIRALAAYEDIGKSPEELQEILYTDNIQISLYQQENEDLHRQIEQLKAERQEIVQKMKAIHDAVIELDGELNL